MGYNVLESPYISPQFMIAADKILDIDDNEVKNYRNIFGNTVVITESSVSDVYKEFNAKLQVKGTYGLFSGSASLEFSQSSTDHEEKAYTKLYAYFVKNRQTIDISENKYKFTDEFVADLNSSMDPVALFNKYGTHLVKEVFLGGRLELNYTTKKTVKDTNLTIKAEVVASYALVSGSASAEYKTKASQLSARSDLNVNVIGGNALAIAGIDDLSSEYKSWCASLDDPTKCAPCGITSYNSLTPIWTFCKNNDRRDKIEETFNHMAGKIIPTEEETFITDIMVISAMTLKEAETKCPPGYLPIGGYGKNLLHFPSGRNRFLCIKRGKRENAITNILCTPYPSGNLQTTINITHNGVTASYHTANSYLNQGVATHYALLYTKDANKYKPIKNMMVYPHGDSLSPEWNGTLCEVNTSQPVNLQVTLGSLMQMRNIHVGYKS